MVLQRNYRITLTLDESEAIALARLAQSEHRQTRSQAHYYMLYRNLVTLGLLSNIPREYI